MTAEPRFNHGDQVLIARSGKGHVWRIVRVDHQPGETEPGYWLEDGIRQRTAAESALVPAPEAAADREAWWERNRGG